VANLSNSDRKRKEKREKKRKGGAFPRLLGKGRINGTLAIAADRRKEVSWRGKETNFYTYPTGKGEEEVGGKKRRLLTNHYFRSPETSCDQGKKNKPCQN